MTINKSEIDITIHLINLLLQIEHVEIIQINKSSTFFFPTSIEYDDDFNFVMVIDHDNKPWFFNSFELKYITVVTKDGETL